MVRPGRYPLSGVVEIDEAYVGGTEEGVHGRETEKIALLAVAVEVTEGRGSRKLEVWTMAHNKPNFNRFCGHVDEAKEICACVLRYL